MIKFKNFVNEAPKKKQPDDDWTKDDYASGYSQLRDMQKQLNWEPRDHQRLQLFVPKRRDPSVELDRQRSRRVYATAKELSVNEEAPPILTNFKEAPPGGNKPQGFWTSSAFKMGDGLYSSDWYKLVIDRFPEWQTDYGYLFEIDSSALIFDLDYADRFYRWSMDTERMSKPESPHTSPHTDSDMRYRFPWDQMSKHFDGARFNGYSHDDFLYGWDVESTVWFNTNVLKYRGAVKLSQHRYDDDE